MRRVLVLLAVVSLAFAGGANAAEVLSQDDQGRTIRFDVRAENVDAEWYATILRAAPHGDEISTVRIDLVSRSELRAVCGEGAAGCYSRNVMVVPAEQSENNAHTVVHEYGHHLDRSTPVAGIAEPNGTSIWWRARGVAELVRAGSVARDYRIGWDRSIAEIFAEDYAQLARPSGRYAIRWLDRPNETVLGALRADLGLGPEPADLTPPAIKPVTIARRGSLAPRKSTAIDFGLLGAGRRVELTAHFAGKAEKTKIRARITISCDGRAVVAKTIDRGKTAVSIDRRNLGPADCTVTLTSASSSKRTYILTVRLSIAAGA